MTGGQEGEGVVAMSCGRRRRDGRDRWVWMIQLAASSERENLEDGVSSGDASLL